MKLSKTQINNIVVQVIAKVKHYDAKTTKDVEVILHEMFNKEFDKLYSYIVETWKNPYRAITNRVAKKIHITISDQFTMQ